MESPEVAEFRQYVLGASWEQAEAALIRLGVTDEDNLMVRSPSLGYLFVISLTRLSIGVEVPHQPTEVSGAAGEQKHHRSFEGPQKRTRFVQRRSRTFTLTLKVRDSDLFVSFREFVDFLVQSLIMCSTPEDLRRRAGWDGARGSSRTRLLNNLQSALHVLGHYHPLLTGHDRAHPIGSDDSATALPYPPRTVTGVATTTMSVP